MEERKLSKGSVITVMSVFLIYGLIQASNEFRVMFLQNQGMSPAQCGYVLAIGSILAAIARPLAGATADKLRSRKGVFIFGAIGYMVTLAALVAFREVRIANFLLCAGFVPFLSVWDPLVFGMIEADGVEATVINKKLDYSLIRIFLSAGYCGINLLYTPIVNRFGDRSPFIITIAFLILILIIAPRLKVFKTVDCEPAPKGEKEKLHFGRLFKNYYLITFVLLSFVMALGNHTSSYLVYLIEEIGMDSSMIGVASGIRVAGEILMMPLVPLLKKKMSLPFLQAFAYGFVIIQMIIYLTVKSPVVIMAAVCLSGVAGGITLSTQAVYLRAMAPRGLTTTTMALSTIMTNFGGVLMSIGGGIIVEKLGIFALYKVSLCFLVLWMVLYFSTWVVGVKVLRKEPTIPMFKKNAESAN